MTAGLLRQIKFLGVVGFLAFGYSTIRPSVVAGLPEQCPDICTGSVSCFEECGIGYSMTNCGEYLGQGGNGSCDYSSWDTCNYVCNATSSCSYSCNSAGSATTCGSYGICVGPANGVCEPGIGENCGNSSDCACGQPTNSSMNTDIANATGNSPTVASACTAAHIMAYSYSLSGAIDCSNPVPNAWNDISCSDKDALRSASIFLLNTMALWILSGGGAAAEGMFSAVWDHYQSISAEPCYPFPT